MSILVSFVPAVDDDARVRAEGLANFLYAYDRANPRSRARYSARFNWTDPKRGITLRAANGVYKPRLDA